MQMCQIWMEDEDEDEGEARKWDYTAYFDEH